MDSRTSIAWVRFFVVLVLMGASAMAHALVVDVDPDWQESEVPAPPAFNRDTLLPLEMPPYVSLQLALTRQAWRSPRMALCATWSLRVVQVVR